MMNIKISISILFLLGVFDSFAQELNEIIPNQDTYNSIGRAVYGVGAKTHTSLFPYFLPDIRQEVPYDSLMIQLSSKNPFPRGFKRWAYQKLFNEHLIRYQSEDVMFTIDPLFIFQYGKEKGVSESNWVNTRGFLIQGSIGKNFAFSTRFYENQAVFPTYIDNYIQKNSVVPGQGFIKTFGDNGFDFSRAEAYISWSASKHFNLQFGHGKHFIGDGYRSLLLSDNAFSYPYLKINSRFWRIQYTNLFTQMQYPNASHSKNLGFRKKNVTMHYLDYRVTNRLNIGLFETIIWESQDSTGYRGFDWNYFNPVIFYRPVEFSLGSPDNALIGFNTSFRFNKGYVAYGQFVLDEFKLSHMTSGDGWWANKYGFQLGVKSYDFLKVPDLYLQAEYNYVRPYTYSHWDPIQNYGHYNQPLAHPFGANFSEWMVRSSWKYNRFVLNAKGIFALYGLDTSNVNYGKDIFVSYNNHASDFGNKVGQGLRTNLTHLDFSLSYILNYHTNMRITAGWIYRKESNSKFTDRTNWFYLSLATSLDRFYYDF